MTDAEWTEIYQRDQARREQAEAREAEREAAREARRAALTPDEIREVLARRARAIANVMFGRARSRHKSGGGE